MDYYTSISIRFAIIFVLICILDIPWIMLNSRYFIYKNKINGYVKSPISIGILWLFVILIYSIFLSIILEYTESVYGALLMGALTGLVIYYTFNATSLVTFPNWNWNVAIADTLWGVVLLSITSVAAFYIMQQIDKNYNK